MLVPGEVVHDAPFTDLRMKSRGFRLFNATRFQTQASGIKSPGAISNSRFI